MSEEVKRIINYLRCKVNEPLEVNENYVDTSILVNINDCRLLLDFIESRQKVIKERIKEINSLYKVIYTKDDRIEGLTELVNQYNDMQYIRKIEEKYISKDKIKELREIDNIDLIQFKIKELLGENKDE